MITEQCSISDMVSAVIKKERVRLLIMQSRVRASREPDASTKAWLFGYERGLQYYLYADARSEVEHEFYLSAADSPSQKFKFLGEGYRAGLTGNECEPPQMVTTQ